jgi:protein O-GlcNAc transferase
MTWLGYPNTTGLATMDARLIDSRTDPAGAEALATERLVRLEPCFLCYRPMLAAPEPRRETAVDAPVVFGSFNLPLKLTPTCLEMWSAALRAVPGSMLVLKHISLKEPWMRERLLERLERAGVSRAAVRILPPDATFREHLDSYAQFDIALDSYPYHGTTTTCEALWMGVPVVTLRGDRHAARVGDSLLHAVGLGELVAGSPPEFAEIAGRLAAERQRLRVWRGVGEGSLREIMRGSALCDGAAFCARFQGAVRSAWREWCAGERPR